MSTMYKHVHMHTQYVHTCEYRWISCAQGEYTYVLVNSISIHTVIHTNTCIILYIIRTYVQYTHTYFLYVYTYVLPIHCDIYTYTEYSRNLLRQTTRDPQGEFLLSDVLLIRICLLHVHYYSKQIILENWFVLRRNLS